MFDIIFIAVLVIFSILSLIKGFLRSFFSLVNWILSSVIAYVATPYAITFFSGKYPEIMLYPVLAIVIFFISVIILGMFTFAISKALLSIFPDIIDKSLGFAFGFAKGYLLTAFVFAMTIAIHSNNLPPISEQQTESEDGRVGPPWLTEAQTYDIVKLGADYIQPIIDGVIGQLSLNDAANSDNFENNEELQEKIEKIDKGGTLKNLNEMRKFYKELKEDDKAQQGYSKKEIEKKDRLIETVQ